MKYRLGVLSSLVLLTGCSKIVVTKLNPNSNAPTTADGIIYALPATVVRVQFKVDRTTEKPAPFASYAAIFAPGLSPVCKPKDCLNVKSSTAEYSIEDGVTFAPYGEPDPRHVFLVKYSGAGAVDQSLTMTWNEAGLLSTASSTVTNRTTDIIMSGISLAAGVASKAMAGGLPSKPAAGGKVPVTTCETILPGSGTNPKDKYFLKDIQSDFVDASIRQLLLTNYCMIDPSDREDLPFDVHPEWTDNANVEPAKNIRPGVIPPVDVAPNLFDKAAAAYMDQIANLQQRKAELLITGGNVLDPVSLLNRIDLEVNTRLTALFIGTKSTQIWNGVVDTRAVPERREGAPPVALPITIVLLSLDSKSGVAIAKPSEIPPGAAQLPDKFVQKMCPLVTCKNYVLTLDYYPKVETQLFSKVLDDTKGDRSFRYRMPAQVMASFGENGNPKASGNGVFWVAQLGTILSLPAGRHSKSLTYNLGLVEGTGGLKTFTLGTTGGLDAATVTSLGTSAGTVLDARTAANLKAATDADPATALTKQDAILKLQDDICTIQQKYNIPCTVQPQ